MSIFSKPNIKNKPSRNGFDLGKRSCFTAQAGMLLPIYSKYVLPGDKIRLNVASLTRTLPLNTDAFARMKEYVDFFFVPYRLLWNKFPDWVIQNTKPVETDSSGSLVTFPLDVPQCDISFILHQNDFATDVDDAGIETRIGAVRLMDYLGYGKFYNWLDDDSTPPSVEQNMWKIAAYQRIYADFYRNSEWEDNDVATWCLNNYSGDIDASGGSKAYKFFKMRYANYKKDLFMSINPDTQFGSVSVAPLNSGNPVYIKYDGASSAASATFSSYGNLGTGNTSKALNITNTASGIDFDNVGISVLDLRQAQALQKWKEVTMINGFRYNEQIQAHFGFRVPDSRAQIAEFIDGFSNTIRINEVVNTAANQGAITGKGVGANQSHQINYDVKEHGVIMAIYHVGPDLDYSQSRINEENLMLDYEDYFIPEFENVGLGDIQSFTISYNNIDSAGQNAQNHIVGNQIRYAHMKSDIDECFGAFAAGVDATLSKWVIPLSDTTIRHFIDAGQGDDLDYRWFKVKPTSVDGLFPVNSNGLPSTDKFLCNFYVQNYAVRSMSVDGMPY